MVTGCGRKLKIISKHYKYLTYDNGGWHLLFVCGTGVGRVWDGGGAGEGRGHENGG
jgi:hypothetical protein